MNVQKSIIPLAAAVLLFSAIYVAAESSGTNEVPKMASQTNTNGVDLVTKNGVKYRNVTILRAEVDALVIQHAGGIAGVPLNEVSDDLQKKYGYDPVKAADTKRQQADTEADRRAAAQARQAAAQAPLNGQDLIAWKLARHAAEMHCKELNPYLKRVAYRSSTKDINVAYANAQVAAKQPTYEVVAEPQRRFMMKSDTGDWTFIIPVKASYYNVEKKARMPAWERMLVKVTNYGADIRVEDVRLDFK